MIFHIGCPSPRKQLLCMPSRFVIGLEVGGPTWGLIARFTQPPLLPKEQRLSQDVLGKLGSDWVDLNRTRVVSSTSQRITRQGFFGGMEDGPPNGPPLFRSQRRQTSRKERTEHIGVQSMSWGGEPIR